jgi:putative serine protease PepD
LGAIPEDGPEDDGPMRGWVSPDDRLWLHPSERASAGMPVQSVGTPGRPPTGRWVFGGMAACVAVTMVVAIVVLTADATREVASPTTTWVTGVPTTEANLQQLTDVKRMTTVATSAHDSTVALLVNRTSGTSTATGVVVEAGGIIVALRPVVTGARSITVVEPDGERESAAYLGTDTSTGITVLHIDDDLPPADMTDGDPSTGSVVVAMAMESRGSARQSPTARLYAGTVLFSGVATGTSSGTGFCTTGVAAPLPSGDIGSPLVDSVGSVVGILDAVTGSGSERTSVFLPADLVRDVAAQIVSHGSVDHGVVGLGVTDAPALNGGGTGALVESVTTGGAAAQAGLRVGDMVVGVDGNAVRSVAELTTRLYAEPPGSALRFTLVRNGTTLHTMVVLTGS